MSLSKLLSILILSFAFCTWSYTQEAIEGTLSFQDDPEKKYAIYVPSGYDDDTANSMMVGLHPFNTSRWDAISWRDTLIQFAEMNDLLLICPDGGADGRIDDPIDTAFTSLIIDSMESWYHVDPNQKYLMGFSWGGKTTYTYGIRRTNEFAGFMPIGAAISGIAEIEDIVDQAQNESFYVIHGSTDNPNVRYFPIIEGLENAGACVMTNYMEGVGHTIDFEDRNAILTEAYLALVEDNCGMTNSFELENQPTVTLLPTSRTSEYEIKSSQDSWRLMEVIDAKGQKIRFEVSGNMVSIDQNAVGMTLFVFDLNGVIQSKKVMVFK